MVKASYCSKDLCLKLEKKGIEASFVIAYEKGKSWYKKYTLDVVCRWLREIHGLHIYTFRIGEKWYFEYQNLVTGNCFSKVGGDSHDEAIINAIEYCLENLI